ncbi:MAG TPA: hypothetical protein VEO20_04305 [Thermoplasmata archaeon]|nr:hypothetical protein [Thermoplasmata archaeon]
MGMGLLRWLLWPLRSDKVKEEDESPRRRRKSGAPKHSSHPGVYRIEVDGEAGRFHGDGPPFSFWSSSRIILILSFLLWWIQPAGPMIAGFVGGRRAGSPMKAVAAATLPVVTIFVANAAYAHNFATGQIDFVASLPNVLSDAVSSILPFLVPYKEFMIAYMRGFAEALTTTFGMGTNGYLMVIIFSYIGGLIAEQTRRELTFRSGSGSSLGVNLVQPIIGGRPYIDDEEDAYEEDEEIVRTRRPVRAHARGRARPIVVPEARRRHRRGPSDRFDEYRQVPAEVYDAEGSRHRVRLRRHPDDEEEAEDEEDEGEAVQVRLHHTGRGREDHHEHHRASHSHAVVEEDDDEEEPSARPKTLHVRTQAEERAIQRFVERALKNYDHSKL